MTRPRTFRLGALLSPGGQHLAAHRHPDHPADAGARQAVLARLAAEAAAGPFAFVLQAEGAATALGLDGGAAVGTAAGAAVLALPAGADAAARDHAAATADIVITAQQDLAAAQEFHADIKARAAAQGRDPAAVQVMAGVVPFVGRTAEEAWEKQDWLTRLIRPAEGLALLNHLAAGTLDLTGLDPEGPLPQAGKAVAAQALIRQIARDNGFSIRQLYEHLAGGRGHLTLAGTPHEIADTLQAWAAAGAADGFLLLPPWLPTGLGDVLALLVPELQRRGLIDTGAAAAQPRPVLAAE